MQKSKYTYRLDNGDTVYFMNGISQEFIKVSKNQAEQVEYLLENEEECRETFPTFYKKMYEKCFITDSHVHEIELLKAKYEQVKQPHLFRLMVLPTYQCNLRCWYCTQEHNDLYITPETVEKLKRLIDKVMADSEIHNFVLSWFGGEPVLGYDTIIELSSYAKEQCEKHGKYFTSDLTTNSTLLNQERISKLISLGVKSFQITIDGPKRLHDTIKCLDQGSAFEKAMENIEYIAQNGVYCAVRFNYTHKNLFPEEIAADLKAHLTSEARKNCQFMLYKVWQEDSNSIPKEKIDKLFYLTRDLGMRPCFGVLELCYADYKNFCCVYPNGKVAKCDNHNPTMLTSEISNDGKIKWSSQITDVPEIKPEDGTACSLCRFFPVCWGPCAGRRQGGANADKCVFDESYIIEMLTNYCRSIDKESD